MTSTRSINKISIEPNNSINDASFNRDKVKVEEMNLDSIASNSINKSHEKTSTIMQKTGATTMTVITSIVEGIGELAEAIIDTGAISKQVMDTPVNAIVDATIIGAKSITDSINNNKNIIESIKSNAKDYDSLTKKTWDNTKAFVSKEHVKTAFDSFYESSGSGIKENAYGFDTIRNVGSGVGYVGGIVAISIATFGVGGAAVGATSAGTSGLSATMAGVAATAGFGKGTEESWNDGASTVQGLAYGTANAAWEGAQFYAGGEINALNVGKNAVANAGVRIGLDSLTGAAEGLVRPAMQGIYKNESYKELFNEAGGWKNVGTQAAMAGAMSAIGESSGLAKSLRENPVENIKINDNEQIPMDLQFFASDNILSNSKKNLDFYNQFPDGRKGVNQDIIGVVMDKAPNRAEEIVSVAKKYFPDAPDTELNKYLKSIGVENGGICDYAATINSIVKKFEDNPEGFEKAFGYPMTRVNDSGFTLLNDDLMLTDLYCYLNKDKMVNIDGVSTFNPSYKNSINYNGSNYNYRALPDVERWLASKGLDLDVKLEPIYNNFGIQPYQYKADLSGENLVKTISQDIEQAFKDNDSVVMQINASSKVTSGSIKMTDINTGNVIDYKDAGHTISIIGMLDDNHVIVDSWGHEYSIDINELAGINTGIYKVKIADSNALDKVSITEKINNTTIDSLIAETTDESKKVVYQEFKENEELLLEEAKLHGKDNLKDFGQLGIDTSIPKEFQSTVKNEVTNITNRAKNIEPTITSDLKSIETGNNFLMGEEHKFKSENRIEEKIINKGKDIANKAKRDLTIDDLITGANDVGDSLRYTYITSADDYTKNIEKTLNSLTDKNYTVTKFKNTWNEGERYKGVNCNLQKEVNGEIITFELQFHTPESYVAKGHVTHGVYEVGQNSTGKINSVYTNLAKQMQTRFSTTLETPRGITGYEYSKVKK